MASKENAVEILLRCSACSGRYHEPYSLSCGHAACLTCILKLEKEDKVKCPDCYIPGKFSDIKPDKRTQCMLDDYYNNCKSESKTGGRTKVDVNMSVLSSPEKWCDLCHNKPNTCKCTTCDLYICSECKSSHINSFGNLDHNILPIGQNIKELRIALKNVIKSIAKEKHELASNARTVQQTLQNFYLSEAEELINLRRLQLLRTKELEDYHNRLESQMREHNMRTTDTLQTYEESLANGITVLNNKMELLVQVLKMNDTYVLEDTLGMVKRETIPELKTMKSQMSDKPQNTSPAKVVRCKSWNPASSTVFSGKLNLSSCKTSESNDIIQNEGKLPISSVNYQQGHTSQPSSTAYNPSSPPRQIPRGPVDFSRLKGRFAGVKEIKLAYTPQSMTLIDNKIYCAGQNPDGLYVYNKNLMLVRSIKTPKIQQPKAITKVGTGDLIIACDDDFGLQQYSELGVDKVASGSFSDVCTHVHEECAKMYALEYKLYRILIFKCKGHAMIPIKKISLHYENFSQWDTLKVHNDGMYVSSFQNNHIYQYTDDGELIKIGRRGSRMAGLFLMPRLCEVDSTGSMVALDSGNRRIQVYTSGQGWAVVPVGGNLRRPVSVAVDRTLNYIWVVDIFFRKLVACAPALNELAV